MIGILVTWAALATLAPLALWHGFRAYDTPPIWPTNPVPAWAQVGRHRRRLAVLAIHDTAHQAVGAVRRSLTGDDR